VTNSVHQLTDAWIRKMLIKIQHDSPPEMTGCPVMLLRHLMEVHMRMSCERVCSSYCKNSWHKYHLLYIAGRYMVHSDGHQWHDTTCLWQSVVDGYFQLFQVDHHDPINRSFWNCWLHHNNNQQGDDPARNSIDVHVQVFMQNDELLLPILQTFTQSTCSLYATPNAVRFQFG